MSAVVLTRSDSARNMRRYYRLDVQPDLFGAWCCVREWGRIGQAGQTRSIPYPTPLEARAALDRQRQKKERKGYIDSIERREGWIMARSMEALVKADIPTGTLRSICRTVGWEWPPRR